MIPPHSSAYGFFYDEIQIGQSLLYRFDCRYTVIIIPENVFITKTETVFLLKSVSIRGGGFRVGKG